MLACPIPHNKWRNICSLRYRESNKQSFSFRILLARGVELVRLRPLLLNRDQFSIQVWLHLRSVRCWRALTGNKLWLTSNIVNLRSTCLWYGRGFSLPPPPTYTLWPSIPRTGVKICEIKWSQTLRKVCSLKPLDVRLFLCPWIITFSGKSCSSTSSVVPFNLTILPRL